MFKIGSLLPHHSNRDNLGVGTGFFLLTNPYTVHLPDAHCYLKIVQTPKQISFKTLLTVTHTICRCVTGVLIALTQSAIVLIALTQSIVT
jgi:hypothetical protein